MSTGDLPDDDTNTGQWGAGGVGGGMGECGDQVAQGLRTAPFHECHFDERPQRTASKDVTMVSTESMRANTVPITRRLFSCSSEK